MKITPALMWMLPLGGLLVGCADGVDYTSRTAPIGACGPVETHVIGIYDSKGEVVEIKLDRPGKHNLVVSAHAGTKWRISTTNGAQLLEVYAVGYHEQLVAVPKGTKVVKDSFDTTGTYACGFTDGTANGCDSTQLLSLAGKMIHHVSSFHGCAGATSWTIGEDLSTTSNCTASEAQYDSIAGCIAFINGETSCGTDPTGGGSGGTEGSGGDQTGTGEPGPVFL